MTQRRRQQAEPMTFDHGVLLAIAALNFFTAITTLLAHQLIQKVEIATNSMKDALVLATGEARHGQGVAEGRAEGKVERADLTQQLKDKGKYVGIKNLAQQTPILLH